MKYSVDSRVRYSEVGQDGKLTLAALVNYLQDCSTFMSEDRGVGIAYLKSRSRAWILASWQIVIEQLPHMGEEIRTTTWAYGFQRFLGYRNYIMTGADGEIKARANSVWIFFDTKAQRPAKLPKDQLEAYELEPRLEMAYEDRRIAPVAEPDSIAAAAPFLVEKHHLDTNHHVNNEQYIVMAAEYLPEEIRLRQIRAEYRMQARLGDEIRPRILRKGPLLQVQLNDRGGKAYAVVEFTLLLTAHGAPRREMVPKLTRE